MLHIKSQYKVLLEYPFPKILAPVIGIGVLEKF